MSTDLATIRSEPLVLEPDTPDEAFAAWRNCIDFIRERVKELDDEWKAAALARVQARGPMTLGHRRFYAAVETTTKATDPAAVLDALLTTTGGDVAAVTACLSVNAWKPGECRKTLPAESFGAVFVTTTKEKLVEGDPPRRKLLEADARFAGGGK